MLAREFTNKNIITQKDTIPNLTEVKQGYIYLSLFRCKDEDGRAANNCQLRPKTEFI